MQQLIATALKDGDHLRGVNTVSAFQLSRSSIPCGLLYLLALLLFLQPTIAQGIQTSLGLGALEGGDDRWQLTAMFANKTDDGYLVNFTYHQFSYGPVVSKTQLVDLGHDFKLFYPRNLYGKWGITAMSESHSLRYKEAEYQSYNQEDIRYNLGVNLGIDWSSDRSSRWQWQVSWTSHLFLAGPLAGLFLATARKQTLMVLYGYRL